MNITKTLGTAALAASILLGTAACGSNASSGSPTSADTSSPAFGVQKDLQTFFGYATDKALVGSSQDAITAAVKKGIELTDPSADKASLKSAMSDFAHLRITHASDDLSIKVDASKVILNGSSATVPASAVHITVNGKNVDDATNAKLAGDIAHMVSDKGSWLISTSK